MTRKTFFKTILGPVGGIGVLGSIGKKPDPYFKKWMRHQMNREEISALAKKIRNRGQCGDVNLMDCYRKGAKIAQDEAKEGDYSNKNVSLTHSSDILMHGEGWNMTNWINAKQSTSV